MVLLWIESYQNWPVRTAPVEYHFIPRGKDQPDYRDYSLAGTFPLILRTSFWTRVSKDRSDRKVNGLGMPGCLIDMAKTGEVFSSF